jgi:hypothetical protein
MRYAKALGANLMIRERAIFSVDFYRGSLSMPDVDRYPIVPGTVRYACRDRMTLSRYRIVSTALYDTY